LNDEYCSGDDASDDVRGQTFIDALIFACQLHDRQVTDVLQCPRRRREPAIDLPRTNIQPTTSLIEQTRKLKQQITRNLGQNPTWVHPAS